MNRAEAHVLMKRLFDDLARLNPRSPEYREHAMVLADLLNLTGFEAQAEGLNLVIAGRYPRDSWPSKKNDIIHASARRYGRRRLNAKERILKQEIGLLRDRIFRARRYCSLSQPEALRWLHTITGVSNNHHAKDISLITSRACKAVEFEPGRVDMTTPLEKIRTILAQYADYEWAMPVVRSHPTYDFIDLGAGTDEEPTIAFLSGRSPISIPRFTILTKDELLNWDHNGMLLT